MKKSVTKSSKSSQHGSTPSSAVVAHFAARPKPSQKVSPADAEDAAVLRDGNVDLAELKEKIDQLPDINAARVVKLHDRITAGEYEIDIPALVDKMLNFERSLKA